MCEAYKIFALSTSTSPSTASPADRTTAPNSNDDGTALGRHGLEDACMEVDTFIGHLHSMRKSVTCPLQLRSILEEGGCKSSLSFRAVSPTLTQREASHISGTSRCSAHVAALGVCGGVTAYGKHDTERRPWRTASNSSYQKGRARGRGATHTRNGADTGKWEEAL